MYLTIRQSSGKSQSNSILQAASRQRHYGCLLKDHFSSCPFGQSHSEREISTFCKYMQACSSVCEDSTSCMQVVVVTKWPLCVVGRIASSRGTKFAVFLLLYIHTPFHGRCAPVKWRVYGKALLLHAYKTAGVAQVSVAVTFSWKWGVFDIST